MASSQAERQIILLSAGAAARRSAMRAQAARLMQEVNWSQLTETLRLRKLLPALGPRILELAQGSASGGFASAVEEAIESGRRQGAFLQLVSLRVMRMLAEAGIRSSALKGPLLGEAIYGDPGRRLSSDVDLLVPSEHLQTAVEVARGLGYRAPTDHVEAGGLPLLHYSLVHERGGLPPLELHWRIHWYERSFARERLLPPVAESLQDWRPAPADELAALLLFYARDGFLGLRLATDLSAWWDAFGTELRPGALDEVVRVYPALGRVLSAAVKVAETVVGIPAAQTISAVPKQRLRECVAVRLANPDPRTSEPQLNADMGLIDGLLTPIGGFGAFVSRQLLPPREVLEERAQWDRDRRSSSRLGHSMRVLVRYGLTIARLLRAPETLRFT
jgi:hypothetical protein